MQHSGFLTPLPLPPPATYVAVRRQETDDVRCDLELVELLAGQERLDNDLNVFFRLIGTPLTLIPLLILAKRNFKFLILFF